MFITTTCLAGGSPLAPVSTHAALHAMPMLHGMETTRELPPHDGARATEAPAG